jgi:hypothetical protein
LADDTIDFASDEHGWPIRHPADQPVPQDGVYVYAVPDPDDADALALVSPPYRLPAGADWPALDDVDAAGGAWLRVVGVS